MVTHTSIYTLLLLPAFLLVMQTLESVTASSNTSGCFTSERNALLDFKNSLVDDSNRLLSWIGDDCCTWVGISCSERTGHVIQLNLRNPSYYDYDGYYDGNYYGHPLRGELNNSVQLQNLKHLTHLDLSCNDFSGVIPNFFGSFTNLIYLNLSYNLYITGKVPHHLGNLSNLQYLDLSNNFGLQNNDSLGWISKLYVLKHLDLTWVDLSNETNWFPAINMLPSLSVLKLARCRLDFSNVPAHSNINFTSLVSLDLSFNDLEGNVNTVFDWLYSLTGLVELSLSDNSYVGLFPDSIFRLRSLTFLDLSDNELRGPIPTEINELTQLRYMDLGSNKFTGNLPRSFGNLSFLKTLDISDNKLNDTFPSFIGQLSKLEKLDIGGNGMSGIISDNYFRNLSNLKELDLSSNSISLNFSSTWTPPFRLLSLDLSSLKVGPSFPRWLRNQSRLNYLSLSDANIDDTIRPWFSSVTNNLLSLDLSGNKIRGDTLLLPSNNLVELDISNNLFSGLLIPNASNELWYLSASNNLLTGAFPRWLCDIKRISEIQLSNNQFSGRLPSCLGSLENLYFLDLTSNSFHGSVPEFLGTIPLYYLLLRNNKFEGYLPYSFQNLTQLHILDLGENAITGIIPTWIGQTLSNLQVLSLRSNRFHGPIPQQLCYLSYLQTLNLAQNNISGSIPSCLHNLTAMSQDQSQDLLVGQKILENLQAVERSYNPLSFISMDLSNNNIVGVIPTELMELVKLVKLNLSGNRIEGRIPNQIGNLIQLISLDLSRNKLVGPIPQSLSNLSFLTNLNLSFNNLSGKIPTGYQLRTLTDPSIYMGNDQLCGAPLNVCGGEDGSSDDSRKEKSDDNVEVWFYSGMGPGLLVGFLGFWGALHFNKRWRYSYFRFLENVYETLAVAIVVRASQLRRKYKKHITEG